MGGFPAPAVPRLGQGPPGLPAPLSSCTMLSTLERAVPAGAEFWKCRGQGLAPMCPWVKLLSHLSLCVLPSVQLCAWRVQTRAAWGWKLPVLCWVHRTSL